ncbi:probable linoleate 9S-lipoxygenase 5 [Amborella trichopoda]|uniref:Lipoxygenase n=1 Tax=Amborella trichopoda TaxID=13333 RepID=U5DD53_AMBTC|nr:probable linoleate 9S-lipoxygenase 5 [Amborella trichopoda]ERN20140.1 hypothetical protein AMTR_s00066p00077770 [Amborella trichopoda]|eukprot:XP_020531847.1 probable linoleate 9S-lipoxygenase 5 [Amborella trichopoda]
MIQCCQNLVDRLKTVRHDSARFQVIKGKVVIQGNLGRCGPGKLVSLQLCSTTVVDQITRRGKLCEAAHLKVGGISQHEGIYISTFKISFRVEKEFGFPGALIVKSMHKTEFFLKCVRLELHGGLTAYFDCHSWVYPISKTNVDRVFFSNKSYVPTQTPTGLRHLREEELKKLRGNGRGERKEWDRIYDYDKYNDLGDPDKGPDLARPVLGGSAHHPYPRRGRTGRAPSARDPSSESRLELLDVINIYVPRDERFSPLKMSEFIKNSIEAIVHFLIPVAKSFFQKDIQNFTTFREIRELFNDRNRILDNVVAEKLKKLVPQELMAQIVKTIRENSTKFPVPQIIQEADDFGWQSDIEFGREMLAGINPMLIRQLEAIKERRLYILDHHDTLMPFLRRINALGGLCIYASRTLLFLRNDAALKPVAIELSLPLNDEDQGSREDNLSDEGWWDDKRVFFPATSGTERALWQLAKAHVAINDSGHHQLISHWLHTHAVVEPFIIATRRQLSSMHPVHKLLHPHFKDTMHINALARGILLNAGGIFEKTMFPGKYALELSSAIYKDWRFDEQALPKDLLKRKMAVPDLDAPSGVRLVFTDYPYALDGLDIWCAIKKWVHKYCSIFYRNDVSVRNDSEIQEWWFEIRQVGHGDKRNENWWFKMDNLSELEEALTIIIWIASALHASVNFGQYGYAGYMPNRPSLGRRFIPDEGTPEFAEFLRNPDAFFLKTVPNRFQTTLGIALIEILSKHASDEVYLGQRESEEWTDNEQVIGAFQEFQRELQQIEKKIIERNQDLKLKNRSGPRVIPYTLLYPDTSNVSKKGGLTGKGVPNSVSI